MVELWAGEYLLKYTMTGTNCFCADVCRPQPKKELSEKDKERQRRNWIWLLAAAGIFTAYVVFSGQVIDFVYEYDEDEVEEEKN